MIRDSNLATFKGRFEGSNPGSLKVNNNQPYNIIISNPIEYILLLYLSVKVILHCPNTGLILHFVQVLGTLP